MICSDLQPSSIVGNSGCLKFLHALDQRFEPPSRRTVMRSLLPGKYEALKTTLKSKLSEIKYCSITTDPCQTISYITVTCHCISSDWKLISVVLSTINVTGDHTAENIAEELKQITDEWNISEKLVASVTDNGANMVAGIRLNGWKHLPCFAHTLNLVVQDNSLIEMICSDLQPSSIVGNSGCLKFLHALDQRFEPPSRRTVMRSLLPGKYEALKTTLKSKLSEIKYCSITTDPCQTTLHQ